MEKFYEDLADQYKLKNLTFVLYQSKDNALDTVSYNDFFESLIVLFNGKRVVMWDDDSVSSPLPALPRVMCNQIWEYVAANSLSSLLQLMRVSKSIHAFSQHYLSLALQYSFDSQPNFYGLVPFDFPAEDFDPVYSKKKSIHAKVKCTFTSTDSISDFNVGNDQNIRAYVPIIFAAYPFVLDTNARDELITKFAHIIVISDARDFDPDKYTQRIAKYLEPLSNSTYVHIVKSDKLADDFKNTVDHFAAKVNKTLQNTRRKRSETVVHKLRRKTCVAVCLSINCLLFALFIALPIYAGVCYGTNQCGVAVLASLIPVSLVMLVLTVFSCLFGVVMWSREYLFYVTRKPVPLYKNAGFSYHDYDGCYDDYDNCCC